MTSNQQVSYTSMMFWRNNQSCGEMVPVWVPRAPRKLLDTFWSNSPRACQERENLTTEVKRCQEDCWMVESHLWEIYSDFLHIQTVNYSVFNHLLAHCTEYCTRSAWMEQFQEELNCSQQKMENLEATMVKAFAMKSERMWTRLLGGKAWKDMWHGSLIR